MGSSFRRIRKYAKTMMPSAADRMTAKSSVPSRADRRRGPAAASKRSQLFSSRETWKPSFASASRLSARKGAFASGPVRTKLTEPGRGRESKPPPL